MRYIVEIWKNLIGTVEIEAKTEGLALQEAYRRFAQADEELPDMEDGYPLSFSIAGDVSDSAEDNCSNRTYSCDSCIRNGDCPEQGMDGNPRWMEESE